MSKHIYLDAPLLGNLEKEYLTKAIDSGYVSTIGPFVDQFEEKFAEYLGTKRAVSTQSGTAALHIALHELGIGPGDEVIVPALTFVATVNAVLYVGASPVIVDVDPETWNISPEEIEKNITTKTKVIIPVHLYGNPCDMNRIMALAGKYNLYVIEDATESLGATYNGRYTGTIGDFGCFSFNGNKTITTGGGGMIVGKDEKRLSHIKFLVNQARDDKQGYYHSELGFNYRMTNIEAAMGLAQMEQISKILEKKKRFNELYHSELKAHDIHFQKVILNAESSCWLTTIKFNRIIDPGKIQARLNKKSIQSRRIFTPLCDFPYLREYRQQSALNASDIHRNGLCLPSSAVNCEDDIQRVCAELKGCC